MRNLNNKEFSGLVKAVLSMKNDRELKKLFQDLMTEKEIFELSNRFKAAGMLQRGISYSIIENETKLSSTTIARVSKWLQKGKGGYLLALDRINKK